MHARTRLADVDSPLDWARSVHIEQDDCPVIVSPFCECPNWNRIKKSVDHSM